MAAMAAAAAAAGPTYFTYEHIRWLPDDPPLTLPALLQTRLQPQNEVENVTAANVPRLSSARAPYHRYRTANKVANHLASQTFIQQHPFYSAERLHNGRPIMNNTDPGASTGDSLVYAYRMIQGPAYRPRIMYHDMDICGSNFHQFAIRMTNMIRSNLDYHVIRQEMIHQLNRCIRSRMEEFHRHAKGVMIPRGNGPDENRKHLEIIKSTYDLKKRIESPYFDWIYMILRNIPNSSIISIKGTAIVQPAYRIVIPNRISRNCAHHFDRVIDSFKGNIVPDIDNFDDFYANILGRFEVPALHDPWETDRLAAIDRVTEAETGFFKEYLAIRDRTDENSIMKCNYLLKSILYYYQGNIRAYLYYFKAAIDLYASEDPQFNSVANPCMHQLLRQYRSPMRVEAPQETDMVLPGVNVQYYPPETVLQGARDFFHDCFTAQLSVIEGNIATIQQVHYPAIQLIQSKLPASYHTQGNRADMILQEVMAFHAQMETEKDTFTGTYGTHTMSSETNRFAMYTAATQLVQQIEPRIQALGAEMTRLLNMARRQEEERVRQQSRIPPRGPRNLSPSRAASSSAARERNRDRNAPQPITLDQDTIRRLFPPTERAGDKDLFYYFQNIVGPYDTFAAAIQGKRIPSKDVLDFFAQNHLRVIKSIHQLRVWMENKETSDPMFDSTEMHQALQYQIDRANRRIEAIYSLIHKTYPEIDLSHHRLAAHTMTNQPPANKQAGGQRRRTRTRHPRRMRTQRHRKRT